MSRPSSFTQETADSICLRLSEGESLRKICSDDSIPQKRTVLKWLGENEDFRTQYARARAEQADHFAEEIIDIADEDPQTIITRGDEDESSPELRIDGSAVQYQRLRIDARKWFASKVAPKKYGDRMELANPAGEAFSVKFESADERA